MRDIRCQALQHARGWLGTPYCHQASTRGEGADCLGLIRGVWRALYGAEPAVLPAYSPEWAERDGAETLLRAAQRHLDAVDLKVAAPGDVILFRFSAGCPAKHCAILSGEDRMIHAWQAQRVCETSLGPWWRRRLCAAFQFPPQT